MFRQESMLSVVKDNASQLLKQFGLEDDMEPMGAWDGDGVQSVKGRDCASAKHTIYYILYETSAEVEMLPVLQFW